MDEQERDERDHGRIIREEVGQHRDRGEDEREENEPAEPTPLDHAVPEASGFGRIIRAECVSDHRLRCDRHGIEREGESRPDLERDLMSGQIGITESGCDSDGDGETASQRGSADEEIGACAGESSDDAPVRAEPHGMFGDCPGDPHEVRHCSDPLGDDGRERRRADPEVETEDQHDLDDEVEHGGSDRNIERPFGVLEAAEIADPGEGQQHCREAEERDPEIDLRIDGGFALSAHQLDQWVPAEVADAGDDNTDNEGKPQALHRLVSGLPVLAGAQQTGDRRGGAVGEEDENGEGDQQERRRQR